jgi:hypothetical protein
MKTSITKKDSEFLIYEGKDGKTVIDVRFEGQDIWLTQEAYKQYPVYKFKKL